MKLSYKLWLDNDGKVFGEGPCNLLRSIEKTGSLHQGAKEMGISYRKAWNLLRDIESRLGFALIDRRAGGTSGGGSKITIAGRTLLERYETFCQEAEEKLQEAFNKHFPDSKSGKITAK
ncbi:MAG: LysR family transcriptional regulator [Proteobacteria bacterium]|nr:LysR family transcriptional regulator [Pseudomonadota bacterium]